MRDDMFKVIVERPRWGVHKAPRAKLRRDKFPDRSFVGIRRQAWETCAWTKHLNENLAPLRRYLHKQVGRQWNDVFSDICKNLDTGSTVKMHVREHIEDFVMVRISFDRQGNWLGQGKWGGPSAPHCWWPDLYVDPFDGTVKLTKPLLQSLGLKTRDETRRSASYTPSRYGTGTFACPDIRLLPDNRLYVKRKGCWFIYQLDQEPTEDPWDLLEKLLSDTSQDYGAWQIMSQRQLSKKELKQAGLKNGIEGDHV